MNIFKPVYYSFSCTGSTVMYCLIDTSMCQAWRWNVESPIKGTTWFPFFEGAQNLLSSTVSPAVFKIYDINSTLEPSWEQEQHWLSRGTAAFLPNENVAISVERELMWSIILEGSRVFSQAFILKSIIPITLPWFCSLLRKHENRLVHLFRSPYFQSMITLKREKASGEVKLPIRRVELSLERIEMLIYYARSY